MDGFHGYGVARYKGKGIGAHRFAYILFRSEIPKGLMVLHTCDNRACVNPAHLELGTQKKNMADCGIRYRAGGQKLKARDYREIHRLYSNDIAGPSEIAKMFGISANYAMSIGRGRCWPEWINGA